MRVTNAVVRKQKKKKILERAAGFRGRKKNCVDLANGPVRRSRMAEGYGRHLKRRDLKTLWIIRVNALLRQHGLKYSTYISALKKALFEKCGHQMGLPDICYIMDTNIDLMRNIVSGLTSPNSN